MHVDRVAEDETGKGGGVRSPKGACVSCEESERHLGSVMESLKALNRGVSSTVSSVERLVCHRCAEG